MLMQTLRISCLACIILTLNCVECDTYCQLMNVDINVVEWKHMVKKTLRCVTSKHICSMEETNFRILVRELEPCLMNQFRELKTNRARMKFAVNSSLIQCKLSEFIAQLDE